MQKDSLQKGAFMSVTQATPSGAEDTLRTNSATRHLNIFDIDQGMTRQQHTIHGWLAESICSSDTW